MHFHTDLHPQGAQEREKKYQNPFGLIINLWTFHPFLFLLSLSLSLSLRLLSTSPVLVSLTAHRFLFKRLRAYSRVCKNLLPKYFLSIQALGYDTAIIIIVGCWHERLVRKATSMIPDHCDKNIRFVNIIGREISLYRPKKNHEINTMA